jgi:type IV pilus assembly protein PilC
MLFSKRLPLATLIDLCRALRHYLGAGLHLPEVFRIQSRKGPADLRAMASRVSEQLQQGNSLQMALEPETALFPPMFLSLTGVGEESGMLPEVFAELEKYFVRQQALKRQFISQITWPVVQFGLAILVIAGLIFILGLLPRQAGNKPYDPLGFGLSGGSGALTFLGIVFGSIALVAGTFWFLRRNLSQRAAVDAWLLRLPAVGPCLRALALGRFCMALRLTFETGMPIAEALRLSLRATGNNAFIAASKHVLTAVRSGSDLTMALGGTGLFPEEFQHVLAVAEESGRLTEVLRQQADHYDDEAGRRMTALTALAGYGVWLFVGALIVFAIFRLATSYIGMIDRLAG